MCGLHLSYFFSVSFSRGRQFYHKHVICEPKPDELNQFRRHLCATVLPKGTQSKPSILLPQKTAHPALNTTLRPLYCKHNTLTYSKQRGLFNRDKYPLNSMPIKYSVKAKRENVTLYE